MEEILIIERVEKMIRKDGKVFGKINIIDLIIIIVLVISAGLFVFTNTIGKDVAKSGDETVVFEFFAEEVPDFVPPHVTVGSKLYDNDTNLELGEVVDVEAGPAKIYEANNEGVTVLSEKEGYNSIRITGKVKGTIGDFGVEIGGVKYGVGHSMTLRAGTAKIYLRISDIREAL